jgi:hypothetical protein
MDHMCYACKPCRFRIVSFLNCLRVTVRACYL